MRSAFRSPRQRRLRAGARPLDPKDLALNRHRVPVPARCTTRRLKSGSSAMSFAAHRNARLTMTPRFIQNKP
jgi:hypothetical protein